MTVINFPVSLDFLPEFTDLSVVFCVSIRAFVCLSTDANDKSCKALTLSLT